MIKPDFDGGSIVNLMSSLRRGLGDTACSDLPAAALPVERVAGSRRVVLLIVDGLGDGLLERRGRDGPLIRHRRGRLSSVFPSTTATAMTTFLTGEAPQQHALTGWFTYFQELDEVLAVLPFVPRRRDADRDAVGVGPAELLGHVPIFDRLPLPTHQIMPADIAHSPFNLAHAGRARIHSYRELEQLFAITGQVLRTEPGPVFVHAYWPDIDAHSHEYGPSSSTVREELHRLDAEFGRFLRHANGTDALVVLCADHGLIDTDEDCTVRVEEHPILSDALALPLCGEPRVAFCYVHEEREQPFLRYLDERLSEHLQVFPSGELIAQGWYGPGTPHPRLHERVGHYTLVMKNRHTIKDRLDGEAPFLQRGVHGGVSAEEMYVPLILAETGR